MTTTKNKWIFLVPLLLLFLGSCSQKVTNAWAPPQPLKAVDPPQLGKTFAVPEDNSPYLLQEQPLGLSAPAIIAGKAYDFKIVDGKLTIIDAGTTGPVDTVTIPPVDPPIPSTGYRMGACTHHYVPLAKLPMFDDLRCYIGAPWVWQPGGTALQPLWQAEVPEMTGIDNYLLAAKAAGKRVMPCINRTPQWFRQEDGSDTGNDFPPIKRGLSRTDPASYADYAEFYFQVVARYGFRTHPESVLRVNPVLKYPGQPAQVKKSGMGLITEIEVGNEHDRWWDVGTEKYMTPQEHGAMLIAVIKRIQQADPKCRVIIGGLTGFDMPYLRALYAVLEAAGVKLPDVNLHHYSHAGNIKGKWPPTWYDGGATYPEFDKDFTIADFVAFAKSKGVRIFVTEFGADTEGPSWMWIKGANFGGITDQQAQAQLLVKTFEAYRKAGVDGAYMFMAADEPYGTGLWQRCGVLTARPNYQPKASWHALLTYYNALKAKN